MSGPWQPETRYRRAVLWVFGHLVPHRRMPYWWSNGWMQLEFQLTKHWD